MSWRKKSFFSWKPDPQATLEESKEFIGLQFIGLMTDDELMTAACDDFSFSVCGGAS